MEEKKKSMGTAKCGRHKEKWKDLSTASIAAEVSVPRRELAAH